MKAALRRQLSRQWRRWCFLAHQRAISPSSSPIQLTCAGKRDGGGAQWHAAFSVLAFARAHSIPYLHTPFQVVEHGLASDLVWLRAWNGLFDLDATGIPTASPLAAQLPCPDPLSLLRRRRYDTMPAETVVLLEHAHAFTNLFPGHLAALRPLLRQAYRPCSVLAEPPLPLQDTLVVHVRRGDVQVSGPHRHRFISAAAIAARCRQLQSSHPQLRHVLLLSASADADLLALSRQGLLLDAHHDVFTHLHWMSQARGLVIAKSSLSYLAAMLNPNLVFYERFEHPPLPGWICYQPIRSMPSH